MRKIKMVKWIAISLLWLSINSFGQTITLSPEAEVSVITCGPGQEELYTAFGHSAIRVVDPQNGIDYAYNYGVFDFSQPNFYLNYTRGLLLFKLGVYAYPDFVNSYGYYKRWVTEQVLNLSQNQKQQVFDFLEWNALPENETYRYDYFYNNCANKVRDVFAETLKDSIRFDGTYITTDYTIRQLTDLYLKEQPWGDLGIDICLGLPIDKKATPYEYMYLPDYVLSSFNHATIRRNGKELPLVKNQRQVLPNIQVETKKAFAHPSTVMLGFAALALLLSMFDIRRKKPSLWFDALLFGVSGIVGLLLVVLWTATDHAAAAKNFNLLWALPTNILMIGIISSRFRPFLRKYALAVTVLSFALLATWSFLPQQLNTVLLPLVGVLGMRSFLLWRYMR